MDHYSSFPVSTNGYKIRVSLKVGVYVHQDEDNSPIEIYNKSRIAYEQGEVNESDVYYYDDSFKDKSVQAYKNFSLCFCHMYHRIIWSMAVVV